MSLLIGALLAALVGLIIYNDAKRWEAQGVRIGRFGPAGWFWISFLVLIVGGPLYLYMRRAATTGGSRRSRFPPPGWHPDPEDSQLLRWWDGSKWTEDRTIANLPPPPEP